MTFAFSDPTTLEVDADKIDAAASKPHEVAWAIPSENNGTTAAEATGSEVSSRKRQPSFGDVRDDIPSRPAAFSHDSRAASAPKVAPALPPELTAWVSEDGGEAVLRIAPCSAAVLAACVRERLNLRAERQRLQSVVKLPDWAHFEVAEITSSTEGKVGVAVETLHHLRAKEATFGSVLEGIGTTMPSANIQSHKSSLAPLLPTGPQGLIRSHSSIVSSGGRSEDVFASSFAELLRLKLYTRRLYDSKTYPVWRRGGQDFRAYVHLRLGQALEGGTTGVRPLPRKKTKSALESLNGSEFDSSSDDDDEGIDGSKINNDDDTTSAQTSGKDAQGNEVSRLQLAASDDVAKTVQSVDRLLACLGRLLGEIALAFPDQRSEFLRHAQLLVEAIYTVLVSEIGRHIGSAEAISKITMQALLQLLDLLLKRNHCVEEVLKEHGLSGGAAVELTAMLEVGPLLSRFANRTVLEMVQFAQRTVRTYWTNVDKLEIAMTKCTYSNPIHSCS
jgi:hypothetical protein